VAIWAFVALLYVTFSASYTQFSVLTFDGGEGLRVQGSVLLAVQLWPPLPALTATGFPGSCSSMAFAAAGFTEGSALSNPSCLPSSEGGESTVIQLTCTNCTLTPDAAVAFSIFQRRGLPSNLQDTPLHDVTVAARSSPELNWTAVWPRRVRITVRSQSAKGTSQLVSTIAASNGYTFCDEFQVTASMTAEVADYWHGDAKGYAVSSLNVTRGTQVRATWSASRPRWLLGVGLPTPSSWVYSRVERHTSWHWILIVCLGVIGGVATLGRIVVTLIDNLRHAPPAYPPINFVATKEVERSHALEAWVEDTQPDD
jgi:hypothetical protein